MLICFIYFLNTLVTYGVFLWLPRILRDASGYRGWRLSLVTALPFVVALVGMVLIGRHSDRTGERKGHLAACAMTRRDRARPRRRLSRQRRRSSSSASRSRSSASGRCRASSGPSRRSSSVARRPPRASRSSIRSGTSAASSARRSWVGCVASSGSYSAGLLVLAAALVFEAILVMTLRLPTEPDARSIGDRLTSPGAFATLPAEHMIIWR